jgi:hypothetical protein
MPHAISGAPARRRRVGFSARCARRPPSDERHRGKLRESEASYPDLACADPGFIDHLSRRNDERKNKPGTQARAHFISALQVSRNSAGASKGHATAARVHAARFEILR